MTQDEDPGLAYLTVAGAAPIEHIEAAAAAGYGNVGLRVVAPLGLTLPHAIIGNAPLVGAIRTACRNTGVRVYDLDALTLAASTDMRQLHAAVEVGAELGAEIVRLVVEDACAFVAAAGRSNGGVCLDVLHLSRSGATPAAVALAAGSTGMPDPGARIGLLSASPVRSRVGVSTTRSIRVPAALFMAQGSRNRVKHVIG